MARKDEPARQEGQEPTFAITLAEFANSMPARREMMGGFIAQMQIEGKAFEKRTPEEWKRLFDAFATRQVS